MKQILVYGDSLGFGMIPSTRDRYPFDKRWPGVLENALNAQGTAVRVIENCLAGRKTLWEDPFRPGRNGAEGLQQAVELNSPLTLVIIGLGTNDFQAPMDIRAWGSALGVGKLIDLIRAAPIEPGMPRPEILVVTPPNITEPKGGNTIKFQGAAERSKGLVDELHAIAKTKAVDFFDLNTVTSASLEDGIHLNDEQHVALGEALAPVVRRIVGRV